MISKPLFFFFLSLPPHIQHIIDNDIILLLGLCCLQTTFPVDFICYKDTISYEVLSSPVGYFPFGFLFLEDLAVNFWLVATPGSVLFVVHSTTSTF